jgi:vancomycin resistance protein YoaR
VIYGAALHAELTVLKHHRESGLGLPVAPGLEAVTGDRLDLALRNDTDETMVLWVRADGSGLTAQVYRMPYGNCAYVRIIGLSQGEREPTVYRIYCDENGRELGREQVLS